MPLAIKRPSVARRSVARPSVTLGEEATSVPVGAWTGLRLFTLGHSTRTLPQVLELLQAFRVTALADIRTVPRSARNPQFNAEVLGQDLARVGLEYLPIKQLGGLRRAKPDSVNGGWENPSFRGYADHMSSAEFERGLSTLHHLCCHRTTVIMCAEAVPWRCHRSLVADAVTVRGAHVEHIMSVNKATPHQLTRFARVEGRHVWYPG